MKIFLDTADIKEIEKGIETGLVDGVTTNPSLLSEFAEGDPIKHLRKICDLVSGPVSAEVTAMEYNNMISEAKFLSEIAENIVVKLPLTKDGLKAAKKLSEEGIKVNITLIFSATQGMLAMKTGAKYISPFVGRLDDISQNGMELIKELTEIKRNYGFKTEILVASIRSPQHVLLASQLGADVSTIPPKIFWQLMKHPLTEIGLEKFLEDWKRKFNHSIIKK